MEDKSSLIKDLIQIAEIYAKTNLDLFKLKAISKSADVISTIIVKIIIFIVISLMAVLLNIGLALWIGELLGKLYFGFFILAAFYVLVALLLHYIPNMIKSPVKNALIVKMLNTKKDEKEIT